MIKLNSQYLVHANLKTLVNNYQQQISEIVHGMKNHTSVGAAEWTGWLDWIHQDHEALITKMEATKAKWLALGIKKVVVIGIGGSYIGARAGIEYVLGTNANACELSIIFVASFANDYLAQKLAQVGEAPFALVVNSKSGTTLEVSVAFRLFRERLLKNAPELADQLIVAVTDEKKGTLKALANMHHYQTFQIESNIGGRFSTLTAVGLFPSVLAGVDVRAYLLGAQQAYQDCFHDNLANNVAAQYAAIRHYLHKHHHLKIECLCSYDPEINFLLEQVKQLFAESEGKDHQGLMPIILSYTTDLHSVGQLIQSGERTFFETVVLVDQPKNPLYLPTNPFSNDDQLDWLVNQPINKLNQAAYQGTIAAHSEEAHVDNLVLTLADWSPFSFGYAYFFFCLTTAFSAYLLGVNPFNQPGVESYKKRMLALLQQ